MSIRDLVRGIWPSAAAREEVEWVQQVETNSCAVACLAMILGVDYAEARSRVPVFDPQQGMVMGQPLRVLAENGWAYQEKWPDYSPAGYQRTRWPLRPWAPLHLCAVNNGDGWHAVVMDRSGQVYDPLRPDRLTLADYPAVYQIVGLWRVG